MENTEFQVNDFVMYGGSGVCVVESIGIPDIRGIDNTKQYYLLKPLYTQDSTIFSPVDNSRVVMRRLITEAQIHELIAQIPDMETIWDDNEKLREGKYLEAIHTYSCLEWARIIKTLYLKMGERALLKKTVGEKDQRFLRMAEDLMFGEMAIPLGISKEKVGTYINEQVLLAAGGKAV